MSHDEEPSSGVPADSRSNAPDMHRSAPAENVDHAHSCCAPSQARETRPTLQVTGRPQERRGTHLIEQATLPAGRFLMGDSTGDGNRPDGETPVHEVEVAQFSIDVTTVTNGDFARFADTTRYVTEAESFGFSAVFHLAVAAEPDEIMGPTVGAPWWYEVRGADWRHPGGSKSSVDGLEDHPVV